MRTVPMSILIAWLVLLIVGFQSAVTPCAACPQGSAALERVEGLLQADSLLQALAVIDETVKDGPLQGTDCAAERAELFRLAAAVHTAIGNWGPAAAQFEACMLANPADGGLAATWMSYYSIMYQSTQWERLVEFADRLLDNRNVEPSHRSRIEFNRAEGLWQLGRDDEAVKAFHRLSFADKWCVIGSFTSAGGAGLDRAFGPEEDPRAERVHTDEARVGCRWRALDFLNPWVDFNTIYDETDGVFYALTFGRVRDAGPVRVSVGVAGAIRVWVDGKLKVREAPVRVLKDALYEFDIELEPGWHSFLCKVDGSDSNREAGISLRLGDVNGNPLKNVEWSNRTPEGVTTVAAETNVETLPAPAEWAVYTSARQRYAAKPSLARAIELLEMADWGDYETEAFTSYPTLLDEQGRATLVLQEYCAVARHEEEDLVKSLAREVRARAPDIFVELEMDRSEDSDPDALRASLADFITRHPDTVPARLGLLMILLRREDTPAFDAEVEALARVAPHSHMLAMFEAGILERKMQPNKALQRLETAYARSVGNLQLLTMLMESYTKAGNTSAIIDLLRNIQRREPACAWPHSVEAQVRLRADMPVLAEEAIHRAMELAPDDAEVFQTAGNIAEARRETKQADELYAQALALDPDLWDVRERLRKLRGEPEWTTWFVKEPIEDLLAADRAKPYAPDAHAYYLLDDCQYLLFEDGAARVSYRAVGRVNDTEGVDRFKQQVFDQPSNMIVGVPERITTLKPDGRVLHGESKNTEFSLPNLEPGDYFEVRYSYWVSSTTPLGRESWENHWLAGGTRRRLGRFQLVRARDCSLRVNLGEHIETAQDDLDGNRVRTTWTARDVPEVLTATEASWKAINEYLVDFTTVGSWQEVGDWYERQTYRRRSASEVARKAAQIVAGTSTPLEEALALAQYVVNEVSYSPQSFLDRAYQPNSDRDILRRGFGDCKDQCTLLMALAKSRGIEAASALAHTELDRDYHYLPAMRFDHVVAVLRVDGRELWVDPTDNIHPSRIPIWLQGREVLLIDKKGSRLVKVPEEEAEQTILGLKTQLSIQETGDASQQTQVIESGSMAAGTFATLSNLERKDWPEQMQKWYAPQLGTMRVSEVDYLAPPMVTDSIAYAFHAVRTLGVTPFGERSLLSGLFQTAWPNTNIITETDRKSPLNVEYIRRRVFEEVSIQFPESLEPEELPRPVTLEILEARYHLSVRRDGARQVVLERELVIHVFEVAADRLAPFREFLARVDESDRALVGLRGAVASPSTLR